MSAVAEPVDSRGFQDLTVVVISIAGGHALEACRVAFQMQGVAVEVLGATCDGKLETSKPPVPLQRLNALRQAKTLYVALVEDTAAPAADWCRKALDALRAGASAVGGPVAVSHLLPARFQALGLCEYARFTADAPGDSPLSGLALAVDRAACLPLVENSALGFVEADVCRALRSSGQGVGYLPELRVTYAHPHPEGAKLRTRCHHGRLYAATRVAGRPWWVRAGRAMSAVALPAVLTLRALDLRDDRPRPTASVAFWVLAMAAAWSWGELVGYVTGVPGKSLESWV